MRAIVPVLQPGFATRGDLPRMVRMVLLSRAQLRYGGGVGLNVTRKSGDGLGLHFAPTWEMVQARRAGYMSKEEYTKLYRGILDALSVEVWAELRVSAAGDKLTFLCYCADGRFCHTYILMDYMIEHFPDQYCYWR